MMLNEKQLHNKNSIKNYHTHKMYESIGKQNSTILLKRSGDESSYIHTHKQTSEKRKIKTVQLNIT